VNVRHSPLPALETDRNWVTVSCPSLQRTLLRYIQSLRLTLPFSVTDAKSWWKNSTYVRLT